MLWMDAIFLECLVFHNALEKIKMGWSHSPHNTEGKIMFYAASGSGFKLQTPGIKLVRYLHGTKFNKAHVSPGLWSTRNGSVLGSWAERSGGMVRLYCSPHSWAFLIWIHRETPPTWPANTQHSASKQPFHSLQELALLCFFFPWGRHRPQTDPMSVKQAMALFCRMLFLSNFMKILLSYRRTAFFSFL